MNRAQISSNVISLSVNWGTWRIWNTILFTCGKSRYWYMSNLAYMCSINYRCAAYSPMNAVSSSFTGVFPSARTVFTALLRADESTLFYLMSCSNYYIRVKYNYSVLPIGIYLV